MGSLIFYSQWPNLLRHRRVAMLEGIIPNGGQLMGRHHSVPHTIQPYASDSQRILNQLQAAGLTQDVLLRDWGVMLWSVRVKGNEVKFKLHPVGKVDEPALKGLLQLLLGTGLAVTVKLKPLSKCCQSACEGCLFGNSEKRPEWLDPFI